MAHINLAVGIDPGRKGAIATIECATRTPHVWAMPDHGEERGVDVWAVDAILAEIPATGACVGLEWNSGRPGEVPDFAYRFGLQTGQLDALLWARGFDILHLASNKWTSRLGLPGKSHHGALEQRAALWDAIYPPYKGLIRGPRGGILDGPLDALLIAEYIRRGYATLTGHKGGRRPPIFRGGGIDDLLSM